MCLKIKYIFYLRKKTQTKTEPFENAQNEKKMLQTRFDLACLWTAAIKASYNPLSLAPA
jgi:hypothetical protein